MSLPSWSPGQWSLGGLGEGHRLLQEPQERGEATRDSKLPLQRRTRMLLSSLGNQFLNLNDSGVIPKLPRTT